MIKFLEKRKVILVYTPLVLYWIVLLWATSFPSISIPTNSVSDKFMHFSAYFVLGVLLNLTLLFQNKYMLLKNFSGISTLLIGSLYGVLDEVHQYFIPGRSMEFLDFAADFGGLTLALILITVFLKLQDMSPKEEI